jgi:DNA-binding PadR family transcriptional regulator
MSYESSSRAGHGGGWRGGAGGSRGRKLSSEELQLLILSLLEQAPAHGYELMRQLEQLSGGYYSPSPGVIYPALAYLDDADEIAALPDGKRKRYSIAPAGAARLGARRDQVEAIARSLKLIGSRMDEVRDAFAGFHDLGPAIAEELHAARRRIKQALHQQRGCTEAEARRIAVILNRAADDILTLANTKTGTAA